MITGTFFSLAFLVGAAGASGELLAEKPIRAGERITFTNSELDGGGEADPEDPRLGREVIRSVYEGRPILAENTRSPRLVRRNDVVVVRYVTSALEITATGRALSEAGVGETITILNIDSRKTLQGVVQPDGGIIVQ